MAFPEISVPITPGTKRTIRPIGSYRRVENNFRTITRPKAKPKPKRKPAYSDPFLSQAQGLASSIFGPLFEQLGARQAAAEQRARQAYTQHAGALEGALGASAAQLPGIYNRAVGGASAIEDQVRAALGNQGEATTGSLTAQLAQINAPGASPLPQTYQNAASANYATGMGDVSRLLQRGAEAQAYAAKQPGIARLTANQDLQAQLGDIMGQFGEEGAELRASLPEAILGLYGNFQEQAGQRDELRSKERLALQALGDEAATRAQERKWEVQDRNFKANEARAMAQYRYMTSAQSDADKRAFEAEMAAIDRQFKAQQNAKNRAANARKNATSGNDTVATAGSAKRNRVVQAAWNAVVNPESGNIRDRFRQQGAKADMKIQQAINATLRGQGVDPFGKEGTQIRRAIFKRLAASNPDYELPPWVR